MRSTLRVGKVWFYLYLQYYSHWASMFSLTCCRKVAMSTSSSRLSFKYIHVCAFIGYVLRWVCQCSKISLQHDMLAVRCYIVKYYFVYYALTLSSYEIGYDIVKLWHSHRAWRCEVMTRVRHCEVMMALWGYDVECDQGVKRWGVPNQRIREQYC